MKYNKPIAYLWLFLLSLLLNSCIEPQDKFTKIPPGIWRGVLYIVDNPMVIKDKEEITVKTDFTGELPFNFDVVYDNDSVFHIEIINGEERIKVEDITFGRSKTIAKDTVGIHFPVYDTYISAFYEERVLEGFWYVNYKKDYKIRFKAWYGENTRFKLPIGKADVDFTGKWAVDIEAGTVDAYPGVAIFKQEENKINGTIETETGDFRYMSGDVLGKKAYLSCFDGAHAFLVEVKMMEDGSLSGQYSSGNSYVAALVGKKDENAKLVDPFGISKPASNQPITYSALKTDGSIFSLSDPAIAQKIKVLLVMGTWCPNCKDATTFLKSYLKENKSDDLAIASIAIERYRDSARVLGILDKYKSKMEVPWDVAIGGYYDKYFR